MRRNILTVGNTSGSLIQDLIKVINIFRKDISQFVFPLLTRRKSDLVPWCITANLPGRNRVCQCKRPLRGSFWGIVYS